MAAGKRRKAAKPTSQGEIQRRPVAVWRFMGASVGRLRIADWGLRIGRGHRTRSSGRLQSAIRDPQSAMSCVLLGGASGGLVGGAVEGELSALLDLLHDRGGGVLFVPDFVEGGDEVVADLEPGAGLGDDEGPGAFGDGIKDSGAFVGVVGEEAFAGGAEGRAFAVNRAEVLDYFLALGVGDELHRGVGILDALGDDEDVGVYEAEGGLWVVEAFGDGEGGDSVVEV